MLVVEADSEAILDYFQDELAELSIGMWAEGSCP